MIGTLEHNILWRPLILFGRKLKKIPGPARIPLGILVFFVLFNLALHLMIIPSSDYNTQKFGHLYIKERSGFTEASSGRFGSG